MRDKPGARLDSCAAYVARAERRSQAAAEAVHAAERALAEAQARQAELDEELAAGQTRLEDLRAELAAGAEEAEEESAASKPGELLRCTKQLLERLETGRFATTVDMPPELLAAMQAVHAVVSATEPTPRPTLDSALEPEGPTATAGGRRKAETMENGADSSRMEDEMMTELAGIDEEDDMALLEMARRLKRARR